MLILIAKNKIILSILVFQVFTIGCEKTVPLKYPDYTGERGIVYDIEGNKYKTIGIGSQIWMAENLRSTRLNDNTEIKYLSDSIEWTTISLPGYCWYDNDTLLKIPYGGLYNWFAINTGKLCPTDWHIPSEGEWHALTNRLGGKNVAGGKLKVIGTDYWNSPNRGATNSANYNAVPGGGIFHSHFWSFGTRCYWWSSTQADTTWITTIALFNKSSSILIGPGGRTSSSGLSVRCIKDNVSE